MQKRKHIRFRPDKLSSAVVDFVNVEGGEGFDPTHVALVCDEAPMGGCGLIVNCDIHIAPGTKFSVRVGDLSPLPAEVRWVKDLGEGVVKLGAQFLK